MTTETVSNPGAIGVVVGRTVGGAATSSIPSAGRGSGVGVWGDFVIYYPRLSDLSMTNYGHYHTIRRSGSDPLQWVGAGYTHQADGSILPYYVKISR